MPRRAFASARCIRAYGLGIIAKPLEGGSGASGRPPRSRTSSWSYPIAFIFTSRQSTATSGADRSPSFTSARSARRRRGSRRAPPCLSLSKSTSPKRASGSASAAARTPVAVRVSTGGVAGATMLGSRRKSARSAGLCPAAAGGNSPWAKKTLVDALPVLGEHARVATSQALCKIVAVGDQFSMLGQFAWRRRPSNREQPTMLPAHDSVFEEALACAAVDARNVAYRDEHVCMMTYNGSARKNAHPHSRGCGAKHSTGRRRSRACTARRRLRARRRRHPDTARPEPPARRRAASRGTRANARSVGARGVMPQSTCAYARSLPAAAAHELVVDEEPAASAGARRVRPMPLRRPGSRVRRRTGPVEVAVDRDNARSRARRAAGGTRPAAIASPSSAPSPHRARAVPPPHGEPSSFTRERGHRVAEARRSRRTTRLAPRERASSRPSSAG